MIVIPTEYAFKLGDIFSPTLYIYRPSYEGMVVLHNQTYGKKDIDRYLMPANFAKLIELADWKAKIITKYKRSEVVVTNTAAGIFSLISTLTATRGLLNIFNGQNDSEKLKTDEIIAYLIVVIGLFGTYFEQTRNSTIRLMIEDLQVTASNIDSIGPMFLNNFNFERNNFQQQNRSQFPLRTEEDVVPAPAQQLTQDNMNLTEKDLLDDIEDGRPRGVYPSYQSTSSSRPQVTRPAASS